MMGWSVMFCAIRSSAASPSSTVTSHRSSQRSSTAPCVTPTTTNGRLTRSSTTASPGSANPSCRSTRTAPVRSAGISLRSSASSASALRGSRIARRYPADVDDPPGGALGEQRGHGAYRLARRTAWTAGGPGGRDRSARQAVPGTGRARAPGRAGRVDGVVATGRHELRRELPVAPLRRRIHGRLAAPRRGHGDGPRLARARRRCPPPRPPCGPRWRRHSPTATRTSSSSGPGCSGSRSPASAKRPSRKHAPRCSRHDSATHRHDRDVTGLVVIDLSALWAGPLCGDLLARAGATVVKVESTQRPDGARRGTREFFDLLNGQKRSVALDLQSRQGIRILRALVNRADIVIEASRPRALAQFGLDAGDVVTATAAPRSGSPSPATAAPARAPTAWRSATTLPQPVVSSCGRDDGPLFCGDAVADPLTGLTAAGACVDALRAGGRWLLDVSMAAVSADLAGPTLPTPTGLAVGRTACAPGRPREHRNSEPTPPASSQSSASRPDPVSSRPGS